MAYTFNKLLDSISDDTFFREYWEKKPMIIQRGNPGYYKGLLSIEDVDFILSQTDLRNPGFRMVRDGKVLPLETYTLGTPSENPLLYRAADVERVLFEYQNGATVTRPVPFPKKIVSLLWIFSVGLNNAFVVSA